jgi:pimeloyl-ACP methyl ester carboxylesterase
MRLRGHGFHTSASEISPVSSADPSGTTRNSSKPMLSLIEKILTFKPNKIDHGGLRTIIHERLRIVAGFGLDLDAAWFPRKSKCVVLFLHGNRHNITRFYDHYALFEKLGVSCLTFDYPGYGESAGIPSEQALYASARAARSFLVEHLNYAPSRIALYGCSLGGSIATELASHSEVGCVITESTFTNSHDIGKFLYPYLPITGFLPLRFRNDANLATVKAPKLLIHGDQDERVPVSMAKTLHDVARGPKELIIVPGADHVNCIIKGGEKLHKEIAAFTTLHCES